MCAYVCDVAQGVAHGKRVVCKGYGSGRSKGVCICEDIAIVRTLHMYVHGTCNDKGIVITKSLLVHGL